MDKILKYSTVGYALLILFGYSYIDTYFSHWGIEIYSYLDASEILLVFLKNINRLVFIVLYFLIGLGVPIFIANKAPTDKLPNVNFYDKKIKTKKELIIAILIVVTSFILVCYTGYQLYNSFQTDSDFYYAFFIAMIILPIYFYFLIPNLSNKYNWHFNFRIIQLIMILLFIYIFNYYTAVNQYIDYRDKKTISNVRFTYRDTNYNSNDTLTYIGTTSKYIFLNNTKKKTNYIFEKENITNLRITKVK